MDTPNPTPPPFPVPNVVAQDQPCLGCGYNLRGVPVGSPCPECGRPVAAFPLSTQPIEMDIHCSTCGYNLRSLLPTGLCPECGSAVARSVHGNLLRFSAPEWLRKLLLGVRLALWIIVAVVLMFIVGAIVGGFAAAANRTSPALFIALNAVGWMIGTGLGLASLFLITAQEPRTALTEDPVTLRKVLRTLAVLSAASGAIQIVVQQISLGASQILALVLSPLSLAWIVSYFGWFVYIRRFARRIPNLALVKSTTRLMWTSGILVVGSAGYGVVMSLLMFFAPTALGFPAGVRGPFPMTQPTTMPASASTTVTGSGGNFTVTTSGGAFPMTAPSGTTTIRPPNPAFLAGMAFGVCLFFGLGIVVAIWYIRLLFQYRNNFRRALEDAEALFADSTMQSPQRFV